MANTKISREPIKQVCFTYVTAFGNMIIVSDGTAINAVYLEKADIGLTGSTNQADIGLDGLNNQAIKLTDEAASQLNEYFSGNRRRFDVPLHPHGTPFQQSVWDALLSIPYGDTRSYKQVAQMIGKPDASRAVGMANNKNPIMIIIPCHRVIGSNGSLVGYAGGLDMKRELLELEKRNTPLFT
jgi:methylated-DNA-[protein]-cysteine S-methyltransferase